MSLLLAVASLELVNLARRIENLLLAGIERVAGRTYFDVQISTESRASDERIAAAAGHVNFAVFWMDVCFHDKGLAYCPRRAEAIATTSLGIKFQSARQYSACVGQSQAIAVVLTVFLLCVDSGDMPFRVNFNGDEHR